MKGKIIFILLLFAFSVNAQNRVNPPSYFGIQLKPLIPGDFLSQSVISASDSGFVGTFSQQRGFSFGGIVRVGLTKLISVETGINQVKRNYSIDFSLQDSSISSQTSFGIISYDIPVNVLVYIQLSEKFFTNASLGTSFVYYPSNVSSYRIVEPKHLFLAEGRRQQRFDLELNANLGFELRTEKNGFFYLGASAKLPFSPIFAVAASYEYGNVVQKSVISEINGSYLSFDLRYFFPIVKTKGPQFNKGPMDI